MREMHEWLSGGVSPCQGEGRGFESRLVLYKIISMCKDFRFLSEVFFVLRRNVIKEFFDDCKMSAAMLY